MEERSSNAQSSKLSLQIINLPPQSSVGMRPLLSYVFANENPKLESVTCTLGN